MAADPRDGSFGRGAHGRRRRRGASPRRVRPFSRRRRGSSSASGLFCPSGRGASLPQYGRKTGRAAPPRTSRTAGADGNSRAPGRAARGAGRPDESAPLSASHQRQTLKTIDSRRQRGLPWGPSTLPPETEELSTGRPTWDETGCCTDIQSLAAACEGKSDDPPPQDETLGYSGQ